jgi:hypothetical protein
VEDPAVKQHTDVEEKGEEWDSVVQYLVVAVQE